MVRPPQSSARFASPSIALAPLFVLFTQYSLRTSSPIWAREASRSRTRAFASPLARLLFTIQRACPQDAPNKVPGSGLDHYHRGSPRIVHSSGVIFLDIVYISKKKLTLKTFRSCHDTIIKFKMIRINCESKKQFTEDLHHNNILECHDDSKTSFVISVNFFLLMYCLPLLIRIQFRFCRSSLSSSKLSHKLYPINSYSWDQPQQPKN